MTSWRDTASASAQEDLDGLLNVVLPLAQELLGKNGQFYPFGASVSADGEAAVTASDPSLGANPEQVLAGVYDGARATAAENRAAAFVTDVLVNGSDAVQVELEHRDGIALVVVVPYTPGTYKRFPKFGELRVAQGEPKVWGPA
ncbi:hypothetical protein [Nocardioides sp. SR21]|uniref:hypothetical protein n=1 Tax=Nocardioides sp. SR21 TaxID=2919501 RepID=UPI001FAA1D6C|nr:hypothetical protein [Nocardioides sp. SR21]